MFDDQPKKPAAPTPESSKASAPVGDIVIRTMPKDFYGREASLKEKEREREQPPAPPKPVPPPPVLTAPVPAPVAAVPKPASVVAKPKTSRVKIFLALGFVGVLVLVGLGAGYLYLSSLQTVDEVVPAPQPIPEPEPEPEPEPVPVPEPIKPVSGADADSDGLTNVEELLYGTDFRNPDTDGDTFLDGNEVFHRYDPLGLAPSTLIDTGSVRVMQSAELPFTIFYPTSWNPTSTPAAKRVVFRSWSTASVTVLWQEKSAELPLDAWYSQNVANPDASRLEKTTKEGYEAYMGPDDRVMYIDGGILVATLMYDLGDATSIEFLQTFKMMANSFKLAPVVQEATVLEP